VQPLNHDVGVTPNLDLSALRQFKVVQSALKHVSLQPEAARLQYYPLLRHHVGEVWILSDVVQNLAIWHRDHDMQQVDLAMLLDQVAEVPPLRRVAQGQLFLLRRLNGVVVEGLFLLGPIF
jgi:hypothetical protein